MKTIIKAILNVVASAEYRLFKLTGIQGYVLKCKWRADSAKIQRMLNSQGIQVFYPKIELD